MLHLWRETVKALPRLKYFQRINPVQLYQVDRSHISNMTTERPGWSENSLQLYNTLLETTKDGKWMKVLTTRNPPPTQPDFGRLTVLDPAVYEYGIFVNLEEQCLKGVCEFGPYAQSAEGMVHGGAIATIIDGATQVLKATLFPDILAVTGNLKVNYKKPLPVGATVFVECHLQKRDGKKFFLSCDLKSADKSILYDTGTALFFDVNDRVNQLPEKCKDECLTTADTVTGWTEESEAVLKQIQEETDPSSWKIIVSTKNQSPRKMFTRLPIGPGSAFEYAWLCNKETIEMRGICQFGPYTQGPDGLVHGGATATMLDSVTGVLMNRGANKKAVTAHLDIKYKLPVPIGSTVRVEAKLERTEGCKNYLQCSLLTPDKSKVLVTGTALYVDLDLLYKS